MSIQTVEFVTMLKFLNEGNYDESCDSIFVLFSSEDIKQFMISTGPILLKNLNEKSQLNLLKMFNDLLKYHEKDVLTNLKFAFSNLAKLLMSSHNSINGSTAFGNSAYFSLKLLTTILLKVSNSNNESLKNILQILILLPSGCLLSGKKRLVYNCRKLIRRFLQKSIYNQQILSIINSTECKVQFLGFMEIISDIIDIKDSINRDLLISYIKLCFNDKFIIPIDIVKQLKCLLLEGIRNKSEFNEHVLPIIQRSALRSPEKSLWIIKIVLNSINNLDLSSESEELLKVFSVQLQSKSESLRNDAKDCLIRVVAVSSESEAIKKILLQLEKLLNQSGSDKINSVDIRQHIWLTIREIPKYISVGSSDLKQNISDFVVGILINLLSKETQETVNIVALDSICEWAKLGTCQVPTTVNSWFKNTIFNPKLSPNLKFNYFLCLNGSFEKIDKLSNLKVLLPEIQDFLEKLSKTQLTISGLHEILPIIDLVIRYSVEIDHVTDNNTDMLKSSSILFNLAFNYIGIKQNVSNIKLFTDQFLINSTKQGLKILIGICRYLMTNFFDQFLKLPDHLAMVLRCLFICGLHSDYLSVRKPALDVIVQLARSQNGEKIVSVLLDYLYTLNLSSPASVLSGSFWPIDSSNQSESVVSIHEPDSFGSIIQRFVQIIDAMLKLEVSSSMAIGKLPLRSLSIDSRFPIWWDDDSRVRIMNRALLSINQHMITYFSLDLWAKHSQNLLDSTDSIVTVYGQEIIDRLMNLEHFNANDKSVVKCLCRNFSEQFINRIISSLTVNLNREQFLLCSEDEIGIMNTLDGYLYNKILLHSLPKYEVNKGNIKRENKNYSYKDQMAEVELRKEIENKKKQSQANKIIETSESDNPLTLLTRQLTKNQMEQVQAELEKEKSIRNRMRELENRANLMCDMLENISHLRKDCFLEHFDEVIKVLNKLMIKSPVARIRAALLFNKLKVLTSVTQKQSIWILRIILLDSSIFNETLIENWKNNNNGKQFLNLINPWMEEGLNECSLEMIGSDFKRHFDLPTFLYYLPAYCQLCQSIADMECPESIKTDSHWWYYLTWMDIDLLMKILETIQKQITNIVINKKQIFNTELLPVMVKVIQYSEINDVQLMVENIVLNMMKLFNDYENANKLELRDTDVIETVLKCFISNTVRARILALECIDTVDEFACDEFCEKLSLYIWMAKHDSNENVVQKATYLSNKLELSVDEKVVFKLQDFVILPYDDVMNGAIGGIASLIEIYNDQLDPLICNIFILYDGYAYLKPPVCDSFGRVLVESPPDQWRARFGLGKTLLALSKFILEKSLVERLFNFLIPKALGDRNLEVRKSMLETGQKVIEYSGKLHINMLLPIMENYLLNADNVVENDIIRQSVVILMGSLAKHLDSSDERFINIFGKLIAALNFPSADVQRSVSDTFDPLIKAFDEEKQKEICNSLLNVLLNSEVEAERKGAAFGIAGIIKAVGITKLKAFKIHDALIEAIQNKQNEKHREIALFTFEQISSKMSKMFEPYVPGILKYLQDSFADPSNLVRQTADRTAKMLMSNLSAPGVKIVLNPLLLGLDTSQWRTKAVSVELLGSMAHCAPKQLSNCLPTIVPKILSILSDSHPNVIKAGRQALRQIGSVIHNKEVQVIVPLLIDALCEPNKKTNEGLDALIDTKFIHQVDAASLALIMSMIARAFKERRSDTKRKAAQIIGNLHSLTDDKDLQPYCSSLLPGLKSCLVDPDPTVRTVASKALGTIAKVMTPVVYEELMCWLMDTLKDETSGVNRSGAAQGFSEVLMHKGISQLDKFMPGILENSCNQKLLSHVRDGYLMLYIYLPRLFRDQFASYVETILPPILQALSDEVEYIRETALNAGQGIIEIYSHIAIDTMLPNLERGMLDLNWRIRYSSIKLLGELLFRLTGISGKGTTSGGTEDESFAQTNSQSILIESLGEETYNRVLAKIYISRMDVALLVKQTATHIWKLMVVNTARCLRSILKHLMGIILESLSESNEDSRVMCTKTLGDVVKKLGERILPDIFGYMEVGFHKCMSDERLGICTAISEILKASPKDQIGNYLDKILPIFKNCMIDECNDVREMSGEIFELLHSAIGVKIVEIIIPDLVEKLDDPKDSDNALNGLCTLVSFKGRIVIPFLIPKLTHPTVNTRAFSKLAKVAGDILSKHLVTVLPALVHAVSNVIEQTNETEEVDNCCEVLLAMDDPISTQTILRDLTNAITSCKSTEEQIAALKIMSGYIKGCKEIDLLVNNRPLMNYIPVIIRSAVKLFLSDNKSILLASYDCVAEIINSMGSDNIEYVKDIRDAIVMIIRERSNKCPNEEVLIPAFCLPERGVVPFIELYREALVNGRSELKEVAASAMEDCITITEIGVLSKAAVKIAGPLIRSMTERHNPPTKSAIVSSLGKLIVKCPTQVKLFAAQMQTIFIKCLADPNQTLRYKTTIAQAKLAVVIAKPDQFFTEFISREFSEENPYKSTGMEAVRFSLESAANRLSKETLIAIMDVFKRTFGDKDDTVRVLGAACLGVTMAHLRAEDFHLLKSVFEKNTSVLNSHSLAVFLIPFLKNGSSKLFSPECPIEMTNLIIKSLEEFCTSDKVFISSAGYRALAFALVHLINEQKTDRLAELLPLLQNAIKHSSMEIKELVIEVCGYLAWNDVNGQNVALYVKTVLAVLINGYRAKENHLRINSEKRIMDLVQLSVSLRKLRNPTESIENMNETVYKTCCDSVEQGSRSALQEVVIRFKKTILSGSKECPTTCPILDNTYNKILTD